MSDGKPEGNFFTRFLHLIQGLGKPKDETVLRPKKGGKEETVPPVTAEMQSAKLASVSNNRLTPLEEKVTPGKEQWQKIKETAKTHDQTDGERWSPKGTILTGSTFDAATTSTPNTKRHKPPTVITQARITNNRLQALQASIDKPKNDIDKSEDGDPNLPGH